MDALLRGLRKLAFVGVLGLIVGNSMGGCLDSGDSSSSSRRRSDDRDDRVSRDDRYNDDRFDDDDFDDLDDEGELEDLPRTADFIDAKKGDRRFRAPEDGRVFIVGAQKGKILGEADIRRGEEFEFRPGSHRGYIDGDEVMYRKSFKDSREYEIHFLEDRR